MQVHDFDTFFQALHNRSPFPWQTRLARQLCEEGIWPEALTLPTSSGKTAALDAALFHLIQDANKPAGQRQAPRRIYFVVDRRLVVDEAYERSKKIANLLKAHIDKPGVLGDAAKKLLELAGASDGKLIEYPLQVVRLRGGMPFERAFITNPLQPAIILTTVDQLGSRMLFRGYGVSDNMRPIHAALTAMDSLILLDEAHLSQPFYETLQAIERYRGGNWCEIPLNLPNAVVQMTATPKAGQVTFGLLEDDYSHSLLNQRLNCAKPTQLVEVKEASELAKVLSKQALDFLKILQGKDGQPVIGVVVNRVATAREVFELLKKEFPEQDSVILLTGRIRDVDREILLNKYLPVMKSGRDPQVNDKPLLVVATQTIEVGADLDFDALVTEAASLDALRQRFGRLNRLGQRTHCRASVVYVKGVKDDPIYGEALPKTWKWLNEHLKWRNENGKKAKGNKEFDFGIQALNDLIAVTAITPLNSLQLHAPVLLPAHLDALAQTSPPPQLSPVPALLLHGLHSREEDVQVVWRGDLPDEILVKDADSINLILQALPPATHESLSIPLSALKTFLREIDNNDLADLEGLYSQNDQVREPAGGKLVINWNAKEGASIIDPQKIRPGSTVVLPASYGGADNYGWHPHSSRGVSDAAEYQWLKRRGKPYLRLHPSLIKDWFNENSPNPDKILKEQQSNGVSDEIQNLLKQLPAWIEDGKSTELVNEILNLALTSENLKTPFKEAIEILIKEKRSELPYFSESILLIAKKNVPQTLEDGDDSTSHTREISLESHSRGVAEIAWYFSERLGLNSDLSAVIEKAALSHDLGKADPRFQALLQGGSLKKTMLLAKGEQNASDRAARQLAQKTSGYPLGQRHECYSVALLKHYPSLLEGLADIELAQYLVGSHHGRGRPYMPAIHDDGTEIVFNFEKHELEFSGAHGLEKLDSGWVELFWSLIRRYGYWGLAFLETIVRLADQQRSEQESKNEKIK